MLNLPNKLSVWYFVSGILLAFTLLLFNPFTPTVKAACYPINPQTGVCDEPLATCSNDTTCCNDYDECTERKACSSDAPHERVPSCDVCGGVLFCSGNNYRLCTTDSTFPNPQLGINRATYVANPPASVTFNGVDYSVPSGGLYYCDSNLYGCGNPACGGGAVGGEGESRLWFPHIRLIAALSTIAQSLFNPKPSTLVKNTAPSNREPSLKNPTVVTTRIEEHQGDDGTTVVNTSDNNSSLIVGREAPAPLYTFGNTSDDNPYNDSAQCRVDPTFTNPGDDLVGPKITGSLYYTQKYEYTAQSKPAGCIADESPYPADRSRLCCSGIYQSNFLCGKLEDVRIPTKGKIALFVKNPLVEYIYNSLVAGSDSLFKRFMPADKTQKFEEIGTPVTFDAAASSANHGDSQTELAVGGDTGATPTLYVPHLGSLKKYWLDDLQKALRPQGVGAQESIGGGEVVSSCPVGSPPYCSVENLLSYFDNDVTKATKASIICQKESGGFPFALNDGCLTGKSFDYSVGLFQYNLASSLNRCPGAFKSIDVAKKSCIVADQKKLDACVQRLFDPEENIKKAVALSGGGENWTDWAAAPACGIK